MKRSASFPRTGERTCAWNPDERAVGDVSSHTSRAMMELFSRYHVVWSLSTEAKSVRLIDYCRFRHPGQEPIETPPSGQRLSSLRRRSQLLTAAVSSCLVTLESRLRELLRARVRPRPITESPALAMDVIDDLLGVAYRALDMACREDVTSWFMLMTGMCKNISFNPWIRCRCAVGSYGDCLLATYHSDDRELYTISCQFYKRVVNFG